MLCVEAFEKAIQSKDVFTDANKNIKILDAGAGTGIIGEMLAKRGYTNVDGLDISQEMLNIAAKKNVYKRLICAPLSEARIEEIQTAEYDAVLCAGTVVYGQVKAAALDECVRHVRPGQYRSTQFSLWARSANLQKQKKKKTEEEEEEKGEREQYFPSTDRTS